jgi:beta-exotoxin I transport system permease protein
MKFSVTSLDLRLRRRAMLGYALGLGAYALAIVALYPSFKGDESLDKLAKSDPTLMAAFGVSGSLTSPTGWLNANLYNNFLPIVLIILAIGYGAWCLAGQDESGTLALVALLPTTRRGLVSQKALALVLHLLPAVLLTYVLMLFGRGFGVDVGEARLVGATVLGLLLAIDFGVLALLVGTVTGRRGIALGVASAVAALSYLVSSMVATVHWLRPARFVSPFYWAVGTDPLDRGVGVGSVLVLVCVAFGLFAMAAAAVRRIDLH